MIIIGDSLISNFNSLNFLVMSFPGITLDSYINNFNYEIHELKSLQNDNNFKLIYCFGINDLNSGISEDELIENYNKLKFEPGRTFIVLPPYQSDDFYYKCENSISLDFEFIHSFTENYESYDGLHPNSNTLKTLNQEILTL